MNIQEQKNIVEKNEILFLYNCAIASNIYGHANYRTDKGSSQGLPKLNCDFRATIF